MISAPSISRWAGPILDVLLDYVGHVTLCSRLMEHLDSYDGWSAIKDKAGEPAKKKDTRPVSTKTETAAHLAQNGHCQSNLDFMPFSTI